MERKQRDKSSDLTKYCGQATAIFFFLAWGLLSPFLGFKAFDSNTVKISFFLAIVPGILIGAIIYFIKKSEENKPAPNKYENTSKETVNNNSCPQTSLSDQLREIKKLHDDGILSEEEFIKLKKEILDNN